MGIGIKKYCGFLFVFSCCLTSYMSYWPRLLRTTEATDLHLCAAMMGTPMGPKLVIDAKACLAQRNMEGELTNKLTDAFAKLPASYGLFSKGSTSIATWFLGSACCNCFYFSSSKYDSISSTTTIIFIIYTYVMIILYL